MKAERQVIHQTYSRQ